MSFARRVLIDTLMMFDDKEQQIERAADAQLRTRNPPPVGVLRFWVCCHVLLARHCPHSEKKTEVRINAAKK